MSRSSRSLLKAALLGSILSGNAAAKPNREVLARSVGLAPRIERTPSSEGPEPAPAPRRAMGKVGSTAIRSGGTKIRTGVVGERDHDTRVVPIAPAAAAPEPPSGSVDPDVLAAEVRAHVREVKMCAARVARRLPVVTGKLAVKWSIETDGSVAAVEIAPDSTVDAEVVVCVQALVARWRFTPPAGAAVKVAFPFVFQ